MPFMVYTFKFLNGSLIPHLLLSLHLSCFWISWENKTSLLMPYPVGFQPKRTSPNWQGCTWSRGHIYFVLDWTNSVSLTVDWPGDKQALSSSVGAGWKGAVCLLAFLSMIPCPLKLVQTRVWISPYAAQNTPGLISTWDMVFKAKSCSLVSVITPSLLNHKTMASKYGYGEWGVAVNICCSG